MAKDNLCPVCGEGVLADIAFDERPGGRMPPRQDPDSREVISYSCGHEVLRGRLASADREQLDIETRVSEETIEPQGGNE